MVLKRNLVTPPSARNREIELEDSGPLIAKHFVPHARLNVGGSVDTSFAGVYVLA